MQQNTLALARVLRDGHELDEKTREAFVSIAARMFAQAFPRETMVIEAESYLRRAA